MIVMWLVFCAVVCCAVLCWWQMSVLEERGFFLRFVSLLINDSIYLLDDALEKIPRLKEEEAAMADTATWLQLSVDDRRAREQQFQSDRQVKGEERFVSSPTFLLDPVGPAFPYA